MQHKLYSAGASEELALTFDISVAAIFDNTFVILVCATGLKLKQKNE